MDTDVTLGLFASSHESSWTHRVVTSVSISQTRKRAQNSHTQLVGVRAGLEPGTGGWQSASLPNHVYCLSHLLLSPGIHQLGST